MEVSQQNISYNELLLQLLDTKENQQLYPYKSNLEVDLYMTLLSQSNCKYPRKKVQEEQKKITNFLRKLNNLKVKIQLKRKEIEIDKLLSEVLEIFEGNKIIISRYNKENIEIDKTIKEKDAKAITSLIDKLTKEKMNQEDKEEKYNTIRNLIYENYKTISYHLENDIISIKNNEELAAKISLELSLDEFKEIFNYLLDIDSYDQIYQKVTTNRLRTMFIGNLISSLTNENFSAVIIPIILTRLCEEQTLEQVEINTSHFIIENIKITDLYSLASEENNQKLTNTAKWKNIIIPNDYLFSKLKTMINSGMYYSNEDKFILESTTNDFKISILKDKLIEFLKEIINKLILSDIKQEAS